MIRLTVRSRAGRSEEAPATRDSALVGCVATLLFEVVDRARQVYGEVVAAAGLTELQWLVLRRLAQEAEPPPLSKIGEWFGTEPPTVTALVDRLQGRGLVERRSDPRDRRVRRVHLTADAHRVLADIDDQASARSPCRDLRRDELEQLRDLLVRMLEPEDAVRAGSTSSGRLIGEQGEPVETSPAT